MSPSSNIPRQSFVVATPGRSVCDDNARALDHHGALRFLALGTRRGVSGIPSERTRLNPKIGFASFAASRFLSTSPAESFRFRLHPWFDRWVLKQLEPGNHLLSSYGYANECFKWVRAHGGRTFLDAGNSHPENFWEILTEENRRWGIGTPPLARHHFERSKAMMADVDFVLSPSQFVSRSFLERGFRPDQILTNIYPIDLKCFSPASVPREPGRPLTIICTGSLSLRKGTPYLLEAFRLVLKSHPAARLRLTRIVHDNVLPILAKHGDLPIDWAPALPHPELAKRLQESDIYVLPSLEEGLARTGLEALACGLPAVVTPNTGLEAFIKPGLNGEIVPIRDPAAIAEAILKWADQILGDKQRAPIPFDSSLCSFERFEREFIGQLEKLNLPNSN